MTLDSLRSHCTVCGHLGQFFDPKSSNHENIYSRVSQTFLQMAPFKEIKKVMAPFNKITHYLP